MIKGTLAQIRAFGMCDPGFAAHEQYMVENNLTELTFDESVELDRRAGRRDWMIFAYENKSRLAQAAGYVIPPEEAAADAVLLNELKTGTPTGSYYFKGQEYETLELAKDAREEFLQENRLRVEPLVNAILVTIQDGHTSWDPIHLNDPSIPVGSEYSYGVFNNLTGQYAFVDTIDAAKLKTEEIIQENFNTLKTTIYSVSKHPWFPDSPILFPVEE